jgi:protein TonB
MLLRTTALRCPRGKEAEVRLSSVASIVVTLTLVGLAGTARAEDAGAGDSLVRLFEAQRYQDVLSLAPSSPQNLERDGLWLASMAIAKDPDAALALSSKLGLSPDDRRRVIAGASFRCLWARRYDAARAFSGQALDAPPTTNEGLRKLQDRYGPEFAALFSGLKRREDLNIPRSDPRAPVIGFMALSGGLTGDARHVFAPELGSVPVPPAHARGIPVANAEQFGLKDFLLPPETGLDMFLAGSTFSTSGDPASGWLVRVIHSLGGIELRFFVIREGEEARVLGVAAPGTAPMLSGVARHVEAQVKAGDVAAARQWIGWVRECVAKTGDARWSGFLAGSTPEALGSPDGVQRAATTLTATVMLPGALIGPAQAPVGSFLSGEGMTRPVLRSSPNGKAAPDWPRGATVSGLSIVKCLLTVEARARDCVVVKKLSPSIDQAILDWLSGCTWAPVTFQGKPQQVSYVFNFKLTAPASLQPDAGPPR